MKHPSDEEWLLYLEGRTTPEFARNLSEHLRSCSGCAEELAAREQAISTLEQLKWPESRSTTRVRTPSLSRWGIAAALVLGIGIVFGRITSPKPPVSNDLRTDIENSMRLTVAAEVRRALANAQIESSNGLAAAEARIIQASAKEALSFWQSVSARLNSAREVDRQAILKMLQEIQQRHESEYVTLHRELETLASITDGEIRQARLRMMHLAAMTQENTKE